eukprot:COSAG02_NODE_3315_length_6950_cov_190.190629_7_plen_160_part_00
MDPFVRISTERLATFDPCSSLSERAPPGSTNVCCANASTGESGRVCLVMEHARYVLRLTKVVRSVRTILAASTFHTPKCIAYQVKPDLTSFRMLLGTQVNLVQPLHHTSNSSCRDWTMFAHRYPLEAVVVVQRGDRHWVDTCLSGMTCRSRFWRGLPER